MSLARKLNLKDGRARVLGRPAGVALGDVQEDAGAQAVLAFVARLADVDTLAAEAIAAAREDRVAWIAYPKARQLGTDLDRDILWRHVRRHGVDAVRQVAVDAVWSAIRFRPGK